LLSVMFEAVTIRSVATNVEIRRKRINMGLPTSLVTGYSTLYSEQESKCGIGTGD
jgi:hypothetical protein